MKNGSLRWLIHSRMVCGRTLKYAATSSVVISCPGASAMIRFRFQQVLFDARVDCWLRSIYPQSGQGKTAQDSMIVAKDDSTSCHACFKRPNMVFRWFPLVTRCHRSSSCPLHIWLGLSDPADHRASRGCRTGAMHFPFHLYLLTLARKPSRTNTGAGRNSN